MSSAANQQVSSKLHQRLRRQSLEQQLKQIIQQIKQTYYEYLSSLKFQNLADQPPYKQTIRLNQSKQQSPSSNVYDVDGVLSSLNVNTQREMDYYAMDKHSVAEVELKGYSFEEELAMENKGYMCFVRLLNNLKQLQDYNHFLRSVVMNSQPQPQITNFQISLVNDLKILQTEIPAFYFGKKL